VVVRVEEVAKELQLLAEELVRKGTNRVRAILIVRVRREEGQVERLEFGTAGEPVCLR
jgi:hypothetical protein